jgi:CBS domain containing-hemolysin-like protein
MEPDHFWGLLYTEIAGFILALLSCALFSFLETSVTALRLFKLKELATSTTRYKKLLETLENNPHQVLIPSSSAALNYFKNSNKGLPMLFLKLCK